MSLTFILPLATWLIVAALWFRGDRSFAIKLAVAWLLGLAAARVFGLYMSWIIIQGMLAVFAALALQLRHR